MKKLSLMIVALFAITCVFAEHQDYDSSCPTKCEPPPPPVCCDQPAAPTMSAYSHPARINVCGSWDFYVTGTFLWWQVMQEQMEYAYQLFGTLTSTENATSPYIGQFYDFKFDWKPAFKVGLGYNFGYDDWSSFLQYTRVNTSMTNTATVGTLTAELLKDLWSLRVTPNTPTIREVKAKWGLDFNILDLEFSRPFYSGKELTFAPHFGLKGGWIDQSLICTSTDTLAVPVLAVNSDYASNSWLIGPRAGLYTNWMIGEGFRFFGNAAVSMFYQKFDDIKVTEPNAADAAQHIGSFTLNSHGVNTALEFLIGLGWGTYFDHNNWYFDLAVGYETQVYFEQNMMRYLEELRKTQTGGGYLNNLGIVTKPGNLMFQGLNVTMRFDF